MLWEHGTDGFEIRSGEPGCCVLVAYFSNGTGQEALRHALEAVPGASIDAAEVPDVDWVARFREGFRPFTAGEFLIAPVWDLPTDPGGRRVLVMDPGQAFGTGTHETTRLCLAALEEIVPRRPSGRVLDLGAGTGILGIAAALLGAGAVTAADLDPLATGAARRHARLNRVELRVVRADGGRAFRDGAFDLVLANLTAPLLLERRDEIAALLSRGGRLVLSGFLVEDLESVRSGYASIGSSSIRTEAGWAAMLVESAS